VFERHPGEVKQLDESVMNRLITNGGVSRDSQQTGGRSVKQSSKTVPSDPRIEQIIDLLVSVVADELEGRVARLAL